MVDQISSGIGYLDHLLGFFKSGENVIWEVEAGTYIEIFLQRFIEQTLKNDYQVMRALDLLKGWEILKKMGSLK